MDWTQTDEATIQAEALVAGDGSATARFEPVDSNDKWAVDRAVVSCTGTAAGDVTCTLHVVSGGVSPSTATQRSGTGSGMFDEADYPVGLTILGDDQLLAVWAGAPAGETAVCTVTYRRYTRDG